MSVIVVPGAAGSLSMDPGVVGSIGWILSQAGSTDLPGRLREALARPDMTVATVCGGSILLAHAGLADGRPLVTHERGQDLAGTKTVPVEARMVDDGNLLSYGNVTSGIDLALYLVERAPPAALARRRRRRTVAGESSWRNGLANCSPCFASIPGRWTPPSGHGSRGLESCPGWSTPSRPWMARG
ncbi:type 1 glutamine amidotransferase family protein [Streptomyces acidicola]|uniref:hypothetical protein n=1 Tax=Streptomyces acidicola TaxID=2596892 RepID=UPI003803B4FD